MQGDLTVGSVDGLIGIQNAGGTVTFRADNLEIAQVINSGARTTLLPFTSGRTIELGNEIGGSLSAADAEFDGLRGRNITSGRYGFG